MENQEKTVNAGALESVNQLSGRYPLFEIYFSPQWAFQSLKDKPRWFFPLVLIIIAYMIFLSLTEIYRMEDLKRNLGHDTSLSAEELARRTENIQMQIDYGVIPEASPTAPLLSRFGEVWRFLDWP